MPPIPRIDAVVWPAHVGHKESLGLQGIIRNTCRDLGVPFLELRLDIFGRRGSTPDEVKDHFSEFFDAMGLG